MIYLDLPGDEPLASFEGQHHGDVLADDGDGVGLLVQREAGLEAEELLQGEGRLRLTLLEAVLGVAVQLEVETV